MNTLVPFQSHHNPQTDVCSRYQESNASHPHPHPHPHLHPHLHPHCDPPILGRIWYDHAIELWGNGQCLHYVLDAFNECILHDQTVPDYYSGTITISITITITITISVSLGRALIETILWQTEKAVCDAKTALSLDPEHVESHYLLAWTIETHHAHIRGPSPSNGDGDGDGDDEFKKQCLHHLERAESTLSRLGVDARTDTKPLRCLLRLYAWVTTWPSPSPPFLRHHHHLHLHHFSGTITISISVPISISTISPAPCPSPSTCKSGPLR